jgi:hypothetical protein
MKSKLVLGAAEYRLLSQQKVNTLLSTALENSIYLVDTAHGYPGSEERIGNFSDRDKFLINTKIGWPDATLFSSKRIKKTLESSLARLKLEQINTLFIHSLGKEYLTYDNLEVLEELKKEGKIVKVGYSGDGKNLKSALRIFDFDEYMATINIIDQSNYELLNSLVKEKTIYFKHVLAQTIWRHFTFKGRLKRNSFARAVFMKPALPEPLKDYCHRFSKLEPLLPVGNYVKTFLEFALFSGTREQFVVVGTNHCGHLLEAIEIEKYFVSSSANDMSVYANWWLREFCGVWEPHVG